MRPKLTIRDFREDDLEWFLDVRNSVRQYLHNSEQFTITQAKAWFPSNSNNYKIILNFDERIGYFRFGKKSLSSTGKPLLEVGADLSLNHQGRGLSYKVYKKYLPKFKREFSVDGFTLQVLPTNVRALNLYLKLGFKISKVFTNIEGGRYITNLEMTYIPLRIPYLRPRSKFDRIILVKQ